MNVSIFENLWQKIFQGTKLDIYVQRVNFNYKYWQKRLNTKGNGHEIRLQKVMGGLVLSIVFLYNNNINETFSSFFWQDQSLNGNCCKQQKQKLTEILCLPKTKKFNGLKKFVALKAWTTNCFIEFMMAISMGLISSFII